MGTKIHRDSLNAWKGLSEIGGLEIDGRDEDLLAELRNKIDPAAKDLDAALANTPIAEFLQALFQVIQPFALMFQDVLRFFETAGARNGQNQWKVSVGDDFVDFQHFEEFLEHWNNVKVEVEVPAIDWQGAWILNNVRIEGGDYDYLLDRGNRDRWVSTGLEDVDVWLKEYDQGRYGPFPASLGPQRFVTGLDDAAAILMTAVSIIRARWRGDRQLMMTEYRARSYPAERRDAFHPSSISQNETDFWLRSGVQYLANLLTRPVDEREAFAAKLRIAYAAFPRRRMFADIEIKDIERILSLPAWQKRHEMYGVWVATEIVGALDGHTITINHANGELKFAFSEARIADVMTARPKIALFSERKSPLASPVGKSRTSSVQPDFGLWTTGTTQEECVLVVEVKHYLRRSRRNFRDALIDYANAHLNATVVLVNYGPVGADFTDLPFAIKERCTMIGFMNHDEKMSRDRFRELVRKRVGEPVITPSYAGRVKSAEIVVVDSSQSMAEILRSRWFNDFIEELGEDSTRFALVDAEVRAVVGREDLLKWLVTSRLGSSTSLAAPVSKLLLDHELMIVLTDEEGMNSLTRPEVTIIQLEIEGNSEVRLLQISKRGAS
jgi:hypothetical protein